jgi:hypothetical protein
MMRSRSRILALDGPQPRSGSARIMASEPALRLTRRLPVRALPALGAVSRETVQGHARRLTPAPAGAPSRPATARFGPPSAGAQMSEDSGRAEMTRITRVVVSRATIRPAFAPRGSFPLNVPGVRIRALPPFGPTWDTSRRTSPPPQVVGSHARCRARPWARRGSTDPDLARRRDCSDGGRNTRIDHHAIPTGGRCPAAHRLCHGGHLDRCSWTRQRACLGLRRGRRPRHPRSATARKHSLCLAHRRWLHEHPRSCTGAGPPDRHHHRDCPSEPCLFHDPCSAVLRSSPAGRALGSAPDRSPERGIRRHRRGDPRPVDRVDSRPIRG